jgi:PAS domain S-box-containing protein
MPESTLPTAARPTAARPLARQILESAPLPILLADEARHIVYANQRLTEQLGFSVAELIGQPLSKLIVQGCDYNARHRLHVSQCDAGCRCGGSREGCLRRVRDREGRELAAKVTEMAAEHAFGPLTVIQIDCQPAGKVGADWLESERLNAIAQAATGLAHESRNAIQRATACLDLLELDFAPNSRQRALSEKIRRSLADLTENYDEVCRFAEPIWLQRAPARLMPLCRQAFERVVSTNGPNQTPGMPRRPAAHRLRIVREQQAEDTAWVDATRMGDVFYRVLDNALGDPSTAVTVMVACLPATLARNAALQVTIQDDGAGFSEEALQHALDPFYTSKQHGNGLGLSTCQRIIQAHGGQIQVSNPEEGGARVTLVLPKDRPRPRSVVNGGVDA